MFIGSGCLDFCVEKKFEVMFRVNRKKFWDLLEMKREEDSSLCVMYWLELLYMLVK